MRPVIGAIGGRYAFRSLWRNPRRTALSAVGMGVAVAISLITISWTRGERYIYTRAAGESGAGHLRITPDGWLKERDPELRLKDGARELAAVRAIPGVKVATPRLRADGLLGLGTRVVAVEVTGVDPSTEQAAQRFVRHVAAGRYLVPGDRGVTVIGRAVAKRLGAEVDDDLVVTAVRKDGEMESAMLRVVGITESGSRDVDATVCHVTLADAEKLSGVPGLGEITLVLDDFEKVPEMKAAVDTVVAPGDVVLTWGDVIPELRAGIEVDVGFGNLSIAIILLVVLLGVTSAQLTAVLERRREFAVLVAIGMRGGRVARVIFAEAAVLGVAGGIAGLLIGTPVVYYLATVGIDLAKLMGGDQGLDFAGILIDPVMYGSMGWWLVPQAFGLSVLAAVLASIYPAWFVSRTDPADALRVAQ